MSGRVFWDWSVERYARPGVKEALLELQDRHGLDVNLMLWCVWLAEQGREASPALTDAVEMAQNWTRRITGPVRSARRESRTEPDAAGLYETLLSAELAAERVLQNRLGDLCPQCPSTSGQAEDLARRALNAYAAHCGYANGFERLLSAVFPPRETV